MHTRRIGRIERHCDHQDDLLHEAAERRSRTPPSSLTVAAEGCTIRYSLVVIGHSLRIVRGRKRRTV